MTMSFRVVNYKCTGKAEIIKWKGDLMVRRCLYGKIQVYGHGENH